MHIYVDMHTVCTGRIFEIYIFVSITRTLATTWVPSTCRSKSGVQSIHVGIVTG